VYLAYLALLNSALFSLLLGEYSPHVAGGQYNLSKKYIDRIPLPNIAEAGQQSRAEGEVVSALADEGRRMHLGDLYRPNVINELVAKLYGTHVNDWPIDR
jgi:hypothetical protein